MYGKNNSGLESFLNFFKNGQYENALEEFSNIKNDESLIGLLNYYKIKCQNEIVGRVIKSNILLDNKFIDQIIDKFYKANRFSIAVIDNDAVKITFSHDLSLIRKFNELQQDTAVSLFDYTILKNKLTKTNIDHFFIEVPNVDLLKTANAYIQKAFEGFLESPSVNCIKLSDGKFSRNENSPNYIICFGKFKKSDNDISSFGQESAKLNNWNGCLFKLKESLVKFEYSKSNDLKNSSFGLPLEKFKNPLELKTKLFENSYVINLSHREDRKLSCSKTFEEFGIQPRFTPAVFGRESKICKEISDSIQNKFIELKDPFKFNYETEFYLKYDTVIQRSSHYFNRNSKIFSAGSVAYMLSYRKALLQAYFDNQHSEFVAIFDDDILLHRDHELILNNLCEQLPTDFNILSLGAIQYNWNENINNFFSKNLYQCFGLSIASHATIYRREIIPLVVQELEKMELPYDVGTLHYIKKVWLDKSYVIFPNLFIQDSSESDIADTQGQLSIGTKKDNVYKWNLEDYFFF